MDNTKNENRKLQVPSRVSDETVKKAVDSLLRWVKSKTKHQKPQLLEHDELLYLDVTLKRIPDSTRVNHYKIPVPHPLFRFVGGQEICLIIDDRVKGLNAEIAQNKVKEEGLPISKVLKYSKLKTDYKPFDAKIKLCDSFDLFLVDKSVVPLLPRLLGKSFFKKKKPPIPVDLTHKQWRGQIESACGSAFLYVGKGTCSAVKVARVSQTRNEIVENVVAVIDGLASVIPRKWKNIRSLHLKSLESLALPLYQSIIEAPLRIEGVKTKSQTNKPKKEAHARYVERKAFEKGRTCDVRYMDHTLGDSSDGFSCGKDGKEVDLLDSLGNRARYIDSLDGEKEITGVLSSKKRTAHAEKAPAVKRKKVLSSVGLQGVAVANNVEGAEKKEKTKK